MIDTDHELLGEKGFISWFISSYTLLSVLKGSQEGNLEAGTEAEAMMDAAYWVAL